MLPIYLFFLFVAILGCQGNTQNGGRVRNALSNGLGNELDDVTELLEKLLEKRTIENKASQPANNLYGPSLRISAFNIRMFGKAKADKDNVMNSLVKIVLRYDIMLIQEIRDASGEAIEKFMKKLNSVAGGKYGMKLSDRLGRSSSKEQYAFLYRSDKVTAEESHQYADTQDWFERPPYSVLFTSNTTELPEFVLLGCHIKPDAAAAEMDRLVEAYEDVVHTWGVQDVLLLGDFNADCSYMTRDEWGAVRLRQDPRFLWLTDDHLDTTVAHASCAYDRVVGTGPAVENSIVQGSVDVFEYDAALGLSHDEALDVSDHYPVEFQLVGKIDADVRRHINIRASLTIASEQAFSADQLQVLVGDAGRLALDVTFLDNGIKLTKHGVLDIPSFLQSLLVSYPQLMHAEVIDLVRLYIARGLLEGIPRIPGGTDDVTAGHDVTISYDLSVMKFTVELSTSLF